MFSFRITSFACLLVCVVFLSVSCQQESTRTPGSGSVSAGSSSGLPTIVPPSEDRAVLYLTMGENQGVAFMNPNGSQTLSMRIGGLTRELARQSILIAARDELGVLTRDEMIGETAFDHEARALLLEFNVGTYLEFKDSKIEIHPADVKFNRDAYDKNHTPAYAYVPFQFQQVGFAMSYPKAIDSLESFSRNEFVDTLKNLHLKAAATLPPKGNTPLPDEVKELLGDLDTVSQFEAVRTIHRLIREKGESLPLLIGLVRGYAQLGLLTDHLATTGSRVFHCRAILYGQRAVARYGETPETLSLRASALSLASCHSLAWSAFGQKYRVQRELKEKGDADAASYRMEPWMHVAEGYLHYNFVGIQNHINNPDFEPGAKRLAKLVQFLQYEYADSPVLAKNKGEKLTVDFPCIRIYDGMYRGRNFDPIYVSGRTTFQQDYDRRLLARLPVFLPPGTWTDTAAVPKETVAVSPVPTDEDDPFDPANDRKAKKTVATPPSVKTDRNAPYVKQGKLIRLLEKTTTSDDPNELSLQALARLVREEVFVQIFETADSIRAHNGNPHDFLVRSRPTIAGHPLETALMSLSKDRDFLASLKSEYPTTRPPYPLLDISSYRIWAWYPKEMQDRFPSPGAVGTVSADQKSYRDAYWVYMRERYNPLSGHQGWSAQVAHRLHHASSKSPLAVAVDMQKRWRFDRRQMDFWSRQLSEFPAINHEIANRLRYDDFATLESLRKSAFDASPTQETARALANLYASFGKTDEAVVVWKQYMDSPDARNGLRRASAAKEAATILNEAKRFKEALPLARTAAVVHSSWGLRTLGLTLEALGDLEAGKVFRSEAMSYAYDADSPITWLMFCQRTGDAALADAEKLVQKQYDQTIKRGNDLSEFFAWFEVSDKPKPEALADPLKLYMEDLSQGFACLALLAAVEKGDEKQLATLYPLLKKEWPRDGSINYANTEIAPEMPLLITMIELDQRLPKADRGNLDEEEIAYLMQLIKNTTIDEPTSARYLHFLAKYFDLCGKKDRATEYYKRCVGQTDQNRYARNYALKELRKSGFSDADYRAVLSDPATRVAYKAYPQGFEDRLCRTLFRDYSNAPSKRLRPSEAKATQINDPAFKGDIQSPWESGLYAKVVGGRFLGEEFSETQSALRLRVKEGRFTLYGFGEPLVCFFEIGPKNESPMKIRLTDWYSEGTLRGLTSMDGKKATLCLNFDLDGDYPASIGDESLPNLVTLELEMMDVVP